MRAKTDANAQLRTFLDEHRGQAGIVYAMTRKKTESIAEMLNARGFTALPYHAGLPGDVRAACQSRFLREDGVIVVATIAFGMGIDKPDVRFVAHVDLPKSVEAYYQETGRAGRDGEAAEAWMVYGLQDVVRLRQLTEMSEADDQHKRIERGKLDALLGWCEVTTCRRRALLRRFGDDLPQDCGNCDVCLTPPETHDGTTAAQKLLSRHLPHGPAFWRSSRDRRVARQGHGKGPAVGTRTGEHFRHRRGPVGHRVAFVRPPTHGTGLRTRG